jgi:hypothetical protein
LFLAPPIGVLGLLRPALSLRLSRQTRAFWFEARKATQNRMMDMREKVRKISQTQSRTRVGQYSFAISLVRFQTEKALKTEFSPCGGGLSVLHQRERSAALALVVSARS